MSLRPKRARSGSPNTERSSKAPRFDARKPTTESLPKMPRFDARNPSTLVADDVEEDEILDFDEFGKSFHPKRNAVKLDGFESDSDNENFDQRATKKANAAKSKEADDTDMFADLEEDMGVGDVNEGGKPKKVVKFLNPDDIEGQDENSRGGGQVHASLLGDGEARVEDVESSSESGNDEDRDRLELGMDAELGAGSKKKHAPRLDAFNMKQENEEGRFDTAGNYVRKANDPDAVHDKWMEGISKKEIRKAREAHEKRLEEEMRREREDDAISVSDMLAVLIENLQRGETALEALQRWGKGIKQKQKKASWNKNKRKTSNGGNAMDIDTDSVASSKSTEDPKEQRCRKAIEDITGAASHLLTHGRGDIYDKEREQLTRLYKQETGEDWVEKQAPDADEEEDPKQWEFRWTDGRDDGDAHGPYDEPMMRAWNEAGYFNEDVEFRAVAGGGDGWSRSAGFV